MKKTLTKADAFYVESHYGLKDAKVLAKDLHTPLKVVQAHLDKLEAAGFARKVEAPEQTDVQKAGLDVRSGSVSMTQAGSEKGDDSARTSGRNEEFFKKRVPGIHVINPKLPVT